MWLLSKKFTQFVMKTLEELGYSRRFLEEVIGSWKDELFDRPEQLPFDQREEIEWLTS